MCRNNDLRLYLKCCEELGATTLDDVIELNMPSLSVTRARQQVQNKEGKWQANDVVKELRNKRRFDFKDILKQVN